MENIDYQRILDCISPSSMNRKEWVKVGMALKEEGQPFEMFDRWSATDSRPGKYQGTEATLRAWESFHGSSASGTATGASLVHIAREQGNDPFPKSAGMGFMDWDDEIVEDEAPKQNKIPTKPAFKATKKEPFQIIDYLTALFQPDDFVNIVTTSFVDKEGKRKPIGAGLMSITVGEYCDQIRSAADSPDWFESVFGSYDREAGAWIRVNPVSGELADGQKGVNDRNVTRYDNALIECDTMALEKQLPKIKELGLPYRAVVYSGGKSVHAIIRVDGKSLADYNEKVTWLQEYCIAHGLPVDEQNKNPSRLSRLPGVDRGAQKQILLETANPIPFDDFRKAALAAAEGEKLEIESFADVYQDLPPLAPEIIDGVLREGHKMLISGPSKAGKSFALISLMIAIAEGREWMGYQCRQGKVLYLNLEIDKRSFWHRIKDIYDALGYPIENVENIDVLHLRGKAEPLNLLAPKLEARIRKGEYSLIVFDPIYKIITGDENNASDMGAFCNLFDQIANAGSCAVAYCHHHSKGSQAQKSVIDRASGSGVFARDPDAIVDMTELYLSDCDREELKAQLIEKITDRLLHETGQWQNLEKLGREVLNDRIQKQELAEKHFELFPDHRQAYEKAVEEMEKLGSCDAFRVSMTLREFASPADCNVLFSYPIHIKDPTGLLDGMLLAGDNSIETMNKKKEERVQKRRDQKRLWFDKHKKAGEPISIKEMCDQFGCHPNTVKNWADTQEDLRTGNGWIVFMEEKIPPQKRKKKAVKTGEE